MFKITLISVLFFQIVTTFAYSNEITKELTNGR